MTEPPSHSRAEPPVSAVLFYDGECGLCNSAVRLLLRWDHRACLHFAPLQGPTAQAYLRSKGLPTSDFESMLFISDWPKRDQLPPKFRTDAVLAALRTLGGGWRAMGVLRVVPRPLRDGVYQIVARLRYRLFGDYHPQPLPRAEWASRFLP